MTQLAQGSTAFDFSSQWFSIGNLDTSLLPFPLTGTNEVFGLRFQLTDRSLIYGYQDVDDDNPRIQWIDDRNGTGNLEFRYADDFMSTESDLVAKMTSDGQLKLPSLTNNFPFLPDNRTRLSVNNNKFLNGISVSTSGLTETQGTGIKARSDFNASNVAVLGIATTSFPIGTPKPFAAAIKGVASNTTSSGSYAGFFNGNVHVTGTFTNPSDRKLKDDIKPTEDALEKISELRSYTYTFKDNDDLHLPQGLQHGLISQELEKVYPELVKETTYPIYNEEDELQGTGSYKSVNYIGLISELTAAVNELNQKLEDLKASKTTLVYSSQFTEEELAKIRANGYQLEQNIPNPFSGATSIQYSLPEKQPAGFYHDL